MALDALVKPLLALPLFEGLKPLQLTEIVRRAERTVYQAGDVIIANNTASDAAIIIVSGTSIRVAGDAAGEEIPEGAMIAELAMLVEIVHASTIIARSRVRALRLTRADMLDLISVDRELGEHFTSRIVARLRDLTNEVGAIDKQLLRASQTTELAA